MPKNDDHAEYIEKTTISIGVGVLETPFSD